MPAKRTYAEYLVLSMLVFLATVIPIYMFSGMSPLTPNHYNSYSLQAHAWLSGHLDIPQNYGHLEIALFAEKYYISFPPFPSLIMLPFVLFLGTYTPDNWIALAFALLTVAYAYRIAYRLLGNEKKAFFCSFLLCAASNYLHISVWGSVWYIAQNMAFAFTMMAIYYAMTDKRSHSLLSLLFLCCAMGCRPFNAIVLPLILILLHERWQRVTPEAPKTPVLFAKHILCNAIPAICLGVFYMALNYARFGNILEFGHNYLPEFTEAPQGQFSLFYLRENLSRIFIHLPTINDSGHVEFPMFNGVAFWIVSPIVLAYIGFSVYAFFRKTERILLPLSSASIIPLLVLLQLFVTAMHKTMGGHHFGNRYTVDCLPVVYLGFLYAVSKCRSKHLLWCAPLAVFGCALNVYGSILYF